MTERPSRILVADDEEQIRFLWHSALLKPPGAYHVVTAGDGCEALEQMTRASFDLLVTDIRMPGMDGLELTETLRQLGYQVAIIWISALSMPNMDAEAQQLGVHCCLRKPLRVAQIRQAVADALAASTQRLKS
ncbi:MAG: response regulator [Chloroflexia bacterium]|nr:response regulator [Chloroflexia bacterium]